MTESDASEQKIVLVPVAEYLESGQNLFDQPPFTWARELVTIEEEEKLGFEPGDETEWYKLLAWTAKNRSWDPDPETGMYKPSIGSSTAYGHKQIPEKAVAYLDRYNLPANRKEIWDPSRIISWDRYLVRVSRFERAYSLNERSPGAAIYYEAMKDNDGYKKCRSFAAFWRNGVRAQRTSQSQDIGQDLVLPRAL